MTDIAIAATSQSQNYPQVAADREAAAGGNLGFFDMLLASSSHSLTRSSLFLSLGRALDATESAPQATFDDSNVAATETREFDEPQADASDETESSPRASMPHSDERREEETHEEPAAAQQGQQISDDRSRDADQGAEAVVQPTSSKVHDSASQAAQPAQTAGRELPAKAVSPELAAAAAATLGRSANANAADKPGGPLAAQAKTEPAGLVSKPQQALAQAAGVVAQEKPKLTQAVADANADTAQNNAELRLASEPVIRRPSGKPNAAVQPAAQTPNGAGTPNAPIVGLAGETSAPRNAASSNASPGSQALQAPAGVAAGTPKMSPFASGLTASASQMPATGEAKNSQPGSFASNLKSTPETFQQLSLQMSRGAALGRDRISLQLHPAELGRVDVKLEFAQDQSLRAVISAERPETLDLLQRDSRLLERALQDAGLKLDNNSLNFAQRNDQQPSHREQSGDDGALASAAADGESDAAEAAAAPQGGDASAGSGVVNIRV